MRNTLFVALLAFIVSVFVPVTTLQADDQFELSMSSAILFALNNNPDVGIAKEKEVQAYYSIDEIRATLYPQAAITSTLGMQYNDPAAGTSPVTSDIRTTNDISFLVTQNIFDGFSTLEEIRGSQEQYNSARYTTELERQKVMVDVVTNYLGVLQAQKDLVLQEKFILDLEDLVGKIRLQFEAGAAPKAKVDYASARLAFARSQLTTARSSYRDTISNLEAITGKLPDFRAMEPDFLYAQKAKLDDYINFVFKNNKELLVNEADKRALEHSYYAEKASLLPRISLNVSGAQKQDDGGRTGLNREAKVALQLNHTLYDGGGSEAARKKILSQIRELEYNDVRLAKDLRRDVKQLYNQLSASEENLIINAEEIQANKDLQKLNRQNFESGTIDIIELIEGEERLVASKIRKHQLVTDIYTNTYELLLLIGLLDKDYFCKTC